MAARKPQRSPKRLRSRGPMRSSSGHSVVTGVVRSRYASDEQRHVKSSDRDRVRGAGAYRRYFQRRTCPAGPLWKTRRRQNVNVRPRHGGRAPYLATTAVHCVWRVPWCGRGATGRAQTARAFGSRSVDRYRSRRPRRTVRARNAQRQRAAGWPTVLTASKDRARTGGPRDRTTRVSTRTTRKRTQRPTRDPVQRTRHDDTTRYVCANLSLRRAARTMRARSGNGSPCAIIISLTWWRRGTSRCTVRVLPPRENKTVAGTRPARFCDARRRARRARRLVAAFSFVFYRRRRRCRCCFCFPRPPVRNRGPIYRFKVARESCASASVCVCVGGHLPRTPESCGKRSILKKNLKIKYETLVDVETECIATVVIGRLWKILIS